MTKVTDVTDADALAAWLWEVDDAHAIDVVYANAGVSEFVPSVAALDDLERGVRQVTATNVTGVINTVLPAIATLRRRGRGQIVITASMAAHGSYMAFSPAYGASKAWALSWGMSLRAALWETGLRVSVLCPGFVDTKMPRALPAVINGVPTGVPASTDNLPAMLTPAAAARIFAAGVARDQAVVTVPASLYLIGHVVYRAPWAVQDWFIRNTTSGALNVWGHAHRSHVPHLPDRAAAVPAAAAAPAAAARSA